MRLVCGAAGGKGKGGVQARSDRAARRGFLGRGGYTLTEVMIAVGVVGILSAIAMPALKKSRLKAQVTTCMANMRAIESAKERWAFTHGGTPTWADLDGYLRKSPPLCPAGGEYRRLEIGSGVYCTVHDWRTAEDGGEGSVRFDELKGFAP